jgi:hypothetical protein
MLFYKAHREGSLQASHPSPLLHIRVGLDEETGGNTDEYYDFGHIFERKALVEIY